MKSTTRHRVATAGLALALAAIGAPVAQATFPDGDSPVPAGAPHEQSPGRSTQARGAALGERVRTEPAPPVIDTSFSLDTAGGFDWADAGVGAGIALGATGLLMGSVLVVRRAGRNRLSTP